MRKTILKKKYKKKSNFDQHEQYDATITHNTKYFNDK